MKPGFVGGLSSRAIIGETGPAFSVKDALALDAKLVPLYRCDMRISIVSIELHVLDLIYLQSGIWRSMQTLK